MLCEEIIAEKIREAVPPVVAFRPAFLKLELEHAVDVLPRLDRNAVARHPVPGVHRLRVDVGADEPDLAVLEAGIADGHLLRDRDGRLPRAVLAICARVEPAHPGVSLQQVVDAIKHTHGLPADYPNPLRVGGNEETVVLQLADSFVDGGRARHGLCFGRTEVNVAQALRRRIHDMDCRTGDPLQKKSEFTGGVFLDRPRVVRENDATGRLAVRDQSIILRTRNDRRAYQKAGQP